MTMTETRPAAPVLLAITPPYSETLLAGLGAVLLHASKDDVTPAINAVRVSSRTFVATDRYTVGEWTHNESAPDTQDGFTIPRGAAEWLTKQTAKALNRDARAITVSPNDEPAVTIEFTADSITIRERFTENDGTPSTRVLAVTTFGSMAAYSFPPVARLFPDRDAEPDAAPARVALNPAYIERFTKGAVKTGERHAPLTMTYTATSNPNKPGPVLFTFGRKENGATYPPFRGLIQPNLLLRP